MKQQSGAVLEKLDGVKQVFRVLSANRLVSLTIALAIFILSSLGQTAVDTSYAEIHSPAR